MSLVHSYLNYVKCFVETDYIFAMDNSEDTQMQCLFATRGCHWNIFYYYMTVRVHMFVNQSVAYQMTGAFVFLCTPLILKNAIIKIDKTRLTMVLPKIQHMAACF